MIKSQPMPNEIVIEPLIDADIASVAELHRQTLPDSLNSRLGARFMENLYDGLTHASSAACWVAKRNGKIVGFVSATIDVGTTRKALEARLSLHDKVAAALKILTSPRNLRDFLAQNIFSFVCLHSAGRLPEILTLGIDAADRGQGVGALLLQEAHSYFQNAGIQSWFVDTMKSNRRAQDFYRKHGYALVRSVAGTVLLKKS